MTNSRTTRRGLSPTGPPGLLRNFPHEPGHCEINRHLKFHPMRRVFFDARRVDFAESFFLAWASPPLVPPVCFLSRDDRFQKRIGLPRANREGFEKDLAGVSGGEAAAPEGGTTRAPRHNRLSAFQIRSPEQTATLSFFTVARGGNLW